MQMDGALDHFSSTPTLLINVPLIYLPGKGGGSRRARADEIEAQIQAAIRRSQDVVASVKVVETLTQELGLTADQSKKLESLMGGCEEHLSGLEEAASDVESLDIPGMYD